MPSINWEEALRKAPASELDRWEGLFAGASYIYGEDAGPIARRAVRYHGPLSARPGRALDLGCGEGQDLAYLAGLGYEAHGVDFSESAVRKSRQLLDGRGLPGSVEQADLAIWTPPVQYDLVLCVNVLQFMGAAAAAVLDRVADAVAAGGVLGVSMLGLESGEERRDGNIWRISLPHLLRRFAGWKPCESARLHQWDSAGREAQLFVTLVIRKP